MDFECPNPQCRHKISIPVTPSPFSIAWQRTGEPPDFTLNPSLLEQGCKTHFFVRNGRPEFCGDSGVGGTPY